MADSIGTITVAIEAQTDELKAGLASAERAVRDSSKKMEQQTENLAQRAEKSWTEFASKMGVIQQVGAIAQQVWNGLDGVLTAVTDKTANASQKMTGAMDAIEQASIPVVSQFLAIGRGLSDWISGERQLRQEIDRRNAALEQSAKKQQEQLRIRQENRKELSSFTTEFLKQVENIEELNLQENDSARINLKQQREKQELEQQYHDLVKKAGKKATAEFLANERHKFDVAMSYLNQIHHRERDGHQKLLDEKAEADRLANEQKVRDAEAVTRKTQSLETQLAIMVAKKAGDEDKARILAIEDRYKAMRVGATKAQAEIIDEMKQMELDALSSASPTSSQSGSASGGTLTASTAIGGFTIATGRSETKKQTGLHEKIANSNEAVADALKNAGKSGLIEVAS